MLVLDRHETEGITITTPEGRVIRVVVVRLGYTVKLGVKADDDVLVLRDELVGREPQGRRGRAR